MTALGFLEVTDIIFNEIMILLQIRDKGETKVKQFRLERLCEAKGSLKMQINQNRVWWALCIISKSSAFFIPYADFLALTITPMGGLI